MYFTSSKCGQADACISAGKYIKGMHFCIGSLLHLIIVYTQSLRKMLDILCAPLLGLFQEAVARNKQMTKDWQEKKPIIEDL